MLDTTNQEAKKDNFCHLHCHSTFSFVDGYGLPEQYIARCKELGQTAIAITDHGNISAHYKWYKECIKNGIKPILGCELYIKKEGETNERKYYHMLALALNNEGYSNLLKIVTEGWQKSTSRKPLVDINFIIQNQKGIMFTNGCPSGKVSQLISKGEIDKAEQELVFLKNSLDCFYIEIAPWDFKMAQDLIKPLYNFSYKLNIPMIAVMDCHYVHKDESTIQEIMLCIQSNDNMSNPERWKFDQNDFYLKSRKEMEDSFKKVAPDLDFTIALDNTLKIADLVKFEFPKAAPLKFPIPESEKILEFKRMCFSGLKFRGLENDKKYIDKSKYEIDLIIKKNFVDYFLVVADLVQWAKKNGILVGPARGSSAGSLVCYLLQITEVDPLIYGLMFERFIDINRMDLPDIDIDFEDEKRPLIKRYLEQKYGIDKVSSVATFSTFKGKNTIQDFGRVYQIPFAIIQKLCSIIIERSGGDSRASFTISDSFNQFQVAKDILKEYPMLKLTPKFEGQLRNMSSHASGIIISNNPLTDFCAVYKNKGENTTSLDYHDASSLGLVKFDILGLNTLTCVRKALDLIKSRTGKEIDIYNLDLNDPRVFEGFRDNKKLFGIFQFDGQAVNQVCRQLQPETFEELSAINALSRPGPMHGMDLEYNQPITSIYIARKWGKLPMSYPHPLLEPITSETQGVVIYQEQVMKVMREVGKMSWKDTAEIRRLISRSVGVERFNDFKNRFAVGARENGLNEHEIDNIWSSICTFGSWAFNKSHSVSYSVISYWTMWLKVYYPIEYYCAMASSMLQEDKVKRVIKEYLREGNVLLPIDINYSKKSFSIENNGLRLGFEQIKGIGSEFAKRIESNQPYYSVKDFEIKMEGTRSINLLAKMGAFQSIGGANKKLSTLFGVAVEKKYEEDTTIEERMKLCPLSVNINILEKWESFIKSNIKFSLEKIENLNPDKGSQMIAGIVYDKNIKDKVEEALTRGKPAPVLKDGLSKYFNFIIEDETDFMTCRVATHQFKQFSSLVLEQISDGDILIVKGQMGTGIRMFFANEIICLNHLKRKLENQESLSESEMVLMGKMWREIPRRKYSNW